MIGLSQRRCVEVLQPSRRWLTGVYSGFKARSFFSEVFCLLKVYCFLLSRKARGVKNEELAAS